MQLVEFRDIAVDPFETRRSVLANAPGGPRFPPEAPAWVHRNAGPPATPLAQWPDFPEDADRLAGTFLYGGALVPHFGHMTAEFMHRLWPLERPELAGATVLFAAPRTGPPPPRFVHEMLDLLGAGPRVFLDRPARIERLVVAEPGKPFGGEARPPYAEFLARRVVPQLAGAPPRPERLAVLRGHVQSGRCLGEAWIGQALAANGYTLFRPEEHSVRVQLEHCLKARQIVFSEGSAIHLVDLLPPLQAEVAVLARRMRNMLPEYSLGPKCRRLVIYRDNVVLLGPEGRPSNDLAFVEPMRFLERLRAEGFIETLPAADFLADPQAVARDVAAYLAHFKERRETGFLQPLGTKLGRPGPGGGLLREALGLTVVQMGRALRAEAERRRAAEEKLAAAREALEEARAAPPPPAPSRRPWPLRVARRGWRKLRSLVAPRPA